MIKDQTINMMNSDEILVKRKVEIIRSRELSLVLLSLTNFY